jgi:glycosyltransferase involved in cell wall biosynthesis
VAYCCQLPSLSVSHWLRVLRKDPKEAFSSKLGMLAPAFTTRWTIQNIDKMIASSDFIRSHLASSNQDQDAEVVHPFINKQNLKALLTAESRTGPPRVLYIGSHRVLRGEDDFLETLATLKREVPEVEGIAVTPHPIPARIQRIVERLGIEDSVKFLPRGVQLDIPSLMQSSDIYVFTGLPPIGSIDPPVTIIEAMILGTEVLAYDAGGIKEIVDPTRLVKYGDTESLAQQGLRLLNQKTERSPRSDLLERFSSEEAAKRFERIYEGLN